MAQSNGRARKGEGGSCFWYVPCRVEPGMFRGEYLVFLDVKDPEDRKKSIQVQLLVDEKEVKIRGVPRRNQPVAALLKVALSDRVADGLAVVVLPQPASRVGQSVLMEEQLVTPDGT